MRVQSPAIALLVVMLAATDARADDVGAANKGLATKTHAKAKVAKRDAPKRDPEAARRAREELLRAVASFGMVSLVAARAKEVDPRATIAPPAATPSPARWASAIDDAFAPGDLRLSSAGETGEAGGADVSLGSVGTVGRGTGMDDLGAYDGRARLGEDRTRRAPPPAPVDRVSADQVQRAVRASFGALRACYETRLRASPGLRGTIAVRFTIARDGRVGVASDAGSTLPDPGVVACVTRAFATLLFPPSSEEVTVVYPLTFRPAE